MHLLPNNHPLTRLIGINDRSANAFGFNDIISGDLSNPSNESTWEYKYDHSGNLVYNNNKDVDYFYNHLNLPDKVDFNGSTNILEFTYDAAGNLLNKKAGASTVEYVGNFVYEDRELIYILMPEGRIVVTSTTKTYEYHVTDHLGNVRVAFEAKSYGAEVTQLSDYYPFGYRHLPVALNNDNNYLYSGKELFEDYGFGWYYFGARFYDAAVGRWHSVDPQASKYSGISPYGAMANNPIIYTDPDGESILAAVAIFTVWLLAKNYHDGYFANNKEANPFKWDWSRAFFTLGYSSNTDGSDKTIYFGIGWSPQSVPTIGYNNNDGLGIGISSPDGANLFYPNKDYNADIKHASKAIEEGRRRSQNQHEADKIGASSISAGQDWKEGPIPGLRYSYFPRQSNTGVTLVMDYVYYSDKYYWYQTIHTNIAEGRIDDYFYIDTDDPNGWYSREWQNWGTYRFSQFSDDPCRPFFPNNSFWKAETSLVQAQYGNGGLMYNIKASCTWGFGMENHRFVVYPLKWGPPSERNINEMFYRFKIKLRYP